jgi:hypothetical protein
VLLYKVVHEEPELGEREGELRDVVAGCLEKDPEDRPTPVELARQLAPGGAAALVAAGWLPGSLVREVSRAAVALLDLEPQDAPAQSGPVPVSGAAWGANDANSGGDVRGGFGPPIEPPASHGPARPNGPPSWPATAGMAESGGPTGSSGFQGQRTPDPRLSVSVSADSGPTRPDANRGRRLSCTVALAVAGALAAVTVGSAYIFDLMPGGGDREAAGHGDAGHTPPAATSTGRPPQPSDPGASGSEQIGGLPKAFIGTWKGPVTEKTSGQPHGTLTAVFTAGKRGTDVVRMATEVSALGLTVRCNSIASLSSGTDKELTLRQRSDPERPSDRALCTSTTSDVHFTHAADGTLRFRSEERGAGLPYGTLTRSGS